MVMPDQDVIPTPDTYFSNEAYGYFEPRGYSAVPVSPSALSQPGSYVWESPPCPAGPSSTGVGHSPPPAHTSVEPRAWPAVPCCKCWCHSVDSPQPWTMMHLPSTPFKTPASPQMMRSISWDFPPNQCSPLPVQTVGPLSCQATYFVVVILTSK